MKFILAFFETLLGLVIVGWLLGSIATTTIADGIFLYKYFLISLQLAVFIAGGVFLVVDGIRRVKS